MGVQGGLGVLTPPGSSYGDVPSLLIIDRRCDKLHGFISLRVCCDLLQEGWRQLWSSKDSRGMQSDRWSHGWWKAEQKQVGLRSDLCTVVPGGCMYVS